MAWRVARLVVICALLAWDAAAQTDKAAQKHRAAPDGWMSAADMRNELYGLDMRGVTQPGSVPWRECIGRDRNTLYQIGDQPDKNGVLTITPDGQACFQYEDGGGGCFRAMRQGGGYLFRSELGGVIFAATNIQRGVETCISENLIG